MNATTRALNHELFAEGSLPPAKHKKAKRQMVARTRNGGTWTEAMFWGRIRGALRKTFAAWVPMQQAMKNARRPSQRADRPLLKWEYLCASCQCWFPLKEEGPEGSKLVQCDHITPAGSLRNFDDLPNWIAKLTDEDPKHFQCLCIACHQVKTNAEREARQTDKIGEGGFGNL